MTPPRRHNHLNLSAALALASFASGSIRGDKPLSEIFSGPPEPPPEPPELPKKPDFVIHSMTQTDIYHDGQEWVKEKTHYRYDSRGSKRGCNHPLTQSRNSRCHCGSGKKYKRCHGRE